MRRGRFGDDLAMRVGTLHAAILRSPYAHADGPHDQPEAARIDWGETTAGSGCDLGAGVLPRALRLCADGDADGKVVERVIIAAERRREVEAEIVRTGSQRALLARADDRSGDGAKANRLRPGARGRTHFRVNFVLF
jgi:hypothetical protein